MSTSRPEEPESQCREGKLAGGTQPYERQPSWHSECSRPASITQVGKKNRSVEHPSKYGTRRAPKQGTPAGVQLLHRLPSLIKRSSSTHQKMYWIRVRGAAVPQPRSSSSPLPSELLHRSEQTAAASALPCKLSASTIQAAPQQPQSPSVCKTTCDRSGYRRQRTQHQASQLHKQHGAQTSCRNNARLMTSCPKT